MSDESMELRVQAALGDAAYQLLSLRDKLTSLNGSLPVPPNQEAMLEGEIPPDLATELSGCIECVIEDHVRQAVDMLQHAACITRLDLARGFREQQRRRRAEAR